jgi:hypothetical protein
MPASEFDLEVFSFLSSSLSVTREICVSLCSSPYTFPLGTLHHIPPEGRGVKTDARRYRAECAQKRCPTTVGHQEHDAGVRIQSGGVFIFIIFPLRDTRNLCVALQLTLYVSFGNTSSYTPRGAGGRNRCSPLSSGVCPETLPRHCRPS